MWKMSKVEPCNDETAPEQETKKFIKHVVKDEEVQNKSVWTIPRISPEKIEDIPAMTEHLTKYDSVKVDQIEQDSADGAQGSWY